MKVLVKKFFRNCFQFVRDHARQKRKAWRQPFNQTAVRIAHELQRASANIGNDRQALREMMRHTTLEEFWAYYVLGKNAPHYHLPWRGREMTKLPADLIIYKDLIEKTRPGMIIEIGTQRGVSALFFAELVKPWGGKVVTIDIRSPEAAMLDEFQKEGVVFICGDATTDAIAAKVKDVVAEKSCFLIDDGSHTYKDVLDAFARYAPLVSSGGFYIIEDGITNWILRNKAFDALGAVDEILRVHSSAWKRVSDYDGWLFFTAYQGIFKKR